MFLFIFTVLVYFASSFLFSFFFFATAVRYLIAFFTSEGDLVSAFFCLFLQLWSTVYKLLGLKLVICYCFSCCHVFRYNNRILGIFLLQFLLFLLFCLFKLLLRNAFLPSNAPFPAFLRFPSLL